MKRFYFTVLLMGAAALFANPACAQVVWSDEFDSGSVPDTRTWSYDLGDDGWGNRELQDYTRSPENARIEDGNLIITARQIPWGDGTRFTSARIRTQDKVTFKYGTLEARIRVPDLADGLWPAFWTLGNNFSEVGWPACGEIDVVEMGSGGAISAGVVNRRVGSTAHWENDDSYATYGQFLDADVDLNDDYHLFRLEWTPESITTYLDGQRVWVMDIRPQNCTDCSEFHQPHFLILNLAMGGNYTGLLTEGQITAPLPAEMHVDYVRIIDNGHTELGGSAIPLDFGGTSPANSGSWYNEEQDGHGFSMEFGQTEDGSPLAVVYWYTYDSLGNPIFMLGTGVPDENRVEVSFNSAYGMTYGDFSPEPEKPVGGTAVFEFSDENNAMFSYTPSADSETRWGHTTPIENLPLVKLFSVPVYSAAVHN